MYDIQAILASTPSFLRIYIEQVAEGDIFTSLSAQLVSLPQFYRALPEDRLTFSYADGKWTPKDILLHLVDAERVFAYRAMRFGRGDSAELVGFDENIYVPAAQANTRNLDSLLEEFEAVRCANLLLFASFSEEQLWQTGLASGFPASVLGLMYAIVGHGVHHLKVIESRYLI